MQRSSAVDLFSIKASKEVISVNVVFTAVMFNELVIVVVIFLAVVPFVAVTLAKVVLPPFKDFREQTSGVPQSSEA